MNKQTLSSYGWIVIITMVLSVMIALASPFGEYIGKAIHNTEKSIISSNEVFVDGLLDATNTVVSVKTLQEKYEFTKIISLNADRFNRADERDTDEFSL